MAPSTINCGFWRKFIEPSALPFSYTIKSFIMEKIAGVINQKFPQFNTILFNRSISEALYQMRCENVDYLIVLDEGENFLGIITEHDVASKVIFSGIELNVAQVGNYKTDDLPVATMEDSLEYALQLLENHNSKYLTVYDQFNFKGVLSIHDIIKVLLVKRQSMFTKAQPQRTGYPWNY